MIGRPVFLLVTDPFVRAFSSESDARSFHAEHYAGDDPQVFEVTGVRLRTRADFHRELVAVKERELAEMRVRLGVPAEQQGGQSE